MSTTTRTKRRRRRRRGLEARWRADAACLVAPTPSRRLCLPCSGSLTIVEKSSSQRKLELGCRCHCRCLCPYLCLCRRPLTSKAAGRASRGRRSERSRASRLSRCQRCQGQERGRGQVPSATARRSPPLPQPPARAVSRTRTEEPCGRVVLTMATGRCW